MATNELFAAAEGLSLPIGSIVPSTMPEFDRKMAHLQRCFQKYGHRFARRKRQMKKNRRKYGMGWKMAQIGKLIQQRLGKEGGPEWAFLGNQGHFDHVVDAGPRGSVPVSFIGRIS